MAPRTIMRAGCLDSRHSEHHFIPCSKGHFRERICGLEQRYEGLGSGMGKGVGDRIFILFGFSKTFLFKLENLKNRRTEIYGEARSAGGKVSCNLFSLSKRTKSFLRQGFSHSKCIGKNSLRIFFPFF